jgi:hypothetical protein
MRVEMALNASQATNAITPRIAQTITFCHNFTVQLPSPPSQASISISVSVSPANCSATIARRTSAVNEFSR